MNIIAHRHTAARLEVELPFLAWYGHGCLNIVGVGQPVCHCVSDNQQPMLSSEFSENH